MGTFNKLLDTLFQLFGKQKINLSRFWKLWIILFYNNSRQLQEGVTYVMGNIRRLNKNELHFSSRPLDGAQDRKPSKCKHSNGFWEKNKMAAVCPEHWLRSETNYVPSIPFILSVVLCTVNTHRMIYNCNCCYCALTVAFKLALGPSSHSENRSESERQEITQTFSATFQNNNHFMFWWNCLVTL